MGTLQPLLLLLMLMLLLALLAPLATVSRKGWANVGVEAATTGGLLSPNRVLEGTRVAAKWPSWPSAAEAGPAVVAASRGGCDKTAATLLLLLSSKSDTD